MRKLIMTYYGIVTLIIPSSGILLALNSEKTNILKDHCTRYCHNKGCVHDAILPEFISGNSGYFGEVIRWLQTIGYKIDALTGMTGTGYGIINLLLFCVAVPAMHLLLASVNISLARRLK